uniref:Secreted protein n=1 Tax=Leptobrachium leishanense TaxID=445787 RepID=A0A8C5M9G1_9ANUR
MGKLSLASVIIILTTAVPDLIGFPPSTAVKINSYIFCISRSNGFSKTSSGDLLPSVLVFSLSVKC